MPRWNAGHVRSVKGLVVLALASALLAPALSSGSGGLALAAPAHGPLPDMRIASFHVDHGTFSPPGFTSTGLRGVTIVLENAGDAPAPDTIVEFAVIRPGGLRDVLIGFESFALAPGERTTFHGTWAPPQDKVGDHDFVATADPADALAERDEFNNAAHARTGNTPVVGVVYPARSLNEDPRPDPALALRPWARFALDAWDAWNPAPWLLLDRSGNGHDAWLPASVPKLVPGRVNDAGAFTGDAFVSAPLPASAQKSVTFWMRPTTASASGVLFATDAPSCERAALTLDGGRFTWHAPAPEPACGSRVTLAAHAPARAWTHVALVAAGASTLVFVDGELAHRHAHEDARDGFATPDARALVGTAFPGADRVPATPLAGVVVDDVLVFDRALSPAEVAVLADGVRSPNA